MELGDFILILVRLMVISSDNYVQIHQSVHRKNVWDLVPILSRLGARKTTSEKKSARLCHAKE